MMMNTQNLTGKKVLMVIAKADFRDEEYLEPYSLLKNEGASITIASESAGPCSSMLGEVEAVADFSIDEVDGEKYDAVVFVGGKGASEYFDSEMAHSIALSAFKAGKVVSAICIAPVILANAGLLKGRKATCFPAVKDRLIDKGVSYTGSAVERDGDIITGEGPEAAAEFAMEVKKALI